MNPNILLNRPAIRGHELRKGVESFAHHICAGLKLRQVRVEWVGGISTAAINAAGDMYLAAVRDDALIKRADVLRYLGFVVHELLHRRYTDFSVECKYGDPRMLRVLHNAIEDAWIERRAIRSGLLGNIEALLVGLLREMTDRARAEVADWTDPAQYPFALAVTCRAYPGVSVPLAQGLAPIFEEASRRIDSCQSSTDTLDLARWVLAQLQSLPQQPQDQPGQQGDQPGDQPQDQPGQQGQSGEGDGQGEGQGEGDSGQQQGEGQGDGQGQQDQPGEGEGQGEGQDQPGKGQGEQPGAARAATGDETAREVEPTLDAPDGTGGSGTFNARIEIGEPGSHLAGSSIHDIDSVSAPRLEMDVRRLFEDSGLTLFSPGRKSGSINAGALGRFGTTDRLFKQRRDIEGIDSAVVVVVDVSGSMFAKPLRIKAALATAALLIKVLQRAGVAVCVTSFGDTSAITVPWGTPTPKALDLLSRLKTDCNTNDHAALKHAHDLLLSRPESRRVCFVLTDGNGDPHSTRVQVAAGETLGLTTIGIGMQLDVSGVYPRNIRVTDLSALATASLRQIKLAA